jgi:DNA polymerase/3'-5' exonuclease PolX
MSNRDIAAVLFNISTILKRQGANPYRVRAYRRAARRVLRLRHSVAERAARGLPLGIPRLGDRLSAKIGELAREGAMAFYNELIEELPPVEQKLMRVPGIGPTLAARIHDDLGAFDAEGLRRAAATGKLQQVWGIGPRRAAAILDVLAS